MKRNNAENREQFKNPRAERHYRNRRRELEKKQRHLPVGRVIWEEVEA